MSIRPGQGGLGPWVGLLLVLLAGLWPLRDCWLTGDLPGAGPDVVSTAWGWWWAGQASVAELMGGATAWVNVPGGAHGTVLSPLSAVLWNGLAWAGAGWAGGGVVWVQVVLSALGTAALAHTLGTRPWGTVIAAAVVVGARLLWFGSGEGSTVAVALVPLPLGLVCLLGARAGGARGWLSAAGGALCMGWTAAENPYLAPILPAAGLVLGARSLVLRRWAAGGILGLATALGLGLGMGVAVVFGASAAPDYPHFVSDQVVQVFGRAWAVVDLPWARAGLGELADPQQAVRWTLDAAGGESAGGGRYLGVVALFLGLVGATLRGPRVAGMVVLFVSMVALSLGSVSDWGAGPFLFLNGLMDQIARPLTQPTRYLAVALVALAVVAGHGADRLCAHRFGRWVGPALLALVLVDGGLFGGLGLRLPTTPLPTVGCADALPPGPVLAWPADAGDGEAGPSMLLQMVHGHAAAHRGIASWRLAGEDARVGLRRAGVQVRNPNLRPAPLRALGFAGVLVSTEDGQSQRVSASLGVPLATCPGWAVHAL